MISNEEKIVVVKWWDGFSASFKYKDIHTTPDFLCLRLAAGNEVTIPLRFNIRWWSILGIWGYGEIKEEDKEKAKEEVKWGEGDPKLREPEGPKQNV